MAALRERRARVSEAPARDAAEPTPAPEQPAPEDDIARFWRLSPEVEALQVRVAPPEVEMEVIKVLGDPAFAEDGSLLTRLTRIYRLVTRKAQEVAFDE